MVNPERTNWRKFCQEPKLTKQELNQLQQIGKLVRKDDAFSDYILAATELKQIAVNIAAKKKSGDWSDVVAWADAYRRYNRIKITAWKTWTQGL